MTSELLAGVPTEVVERAATIEAVVFDVDGVITDGRLWYGPTGEMMKAMDVRDGHGIVLIRHVGLRFAVLSGRPQKLLAKRFQELRFHHIEERCIDKADGVRRVVEALNASLETTCFVGDDVNDVPALELVGLACTPADACAEARAAADFVCEAPGGRGAVREVCELLLKARGQWPVP